MTSKCRDFGEQVSLGRRSSPQSPTWSFPEAAAAWLRGGGELPGPTQRLSAQCPDGRGCRGLQKPAAMLHFSNSGPPPSLTTPAPGLQPLLGSGHPAPRGGGVQWPRELVAREEALVERPSHPGGPNHTLEESREPRACFPLVFWGITMGCQPRGPSPPRVPGGVSPARPRWRVRSWAGGPGSTGGCGLSWARWLPGGLSRLPRGLARPSPGSGLPPRGRPALPASAPHSLPALGWAFPLRRRQQL